MTRDGADHRHNGGWGRPPPGSTACGPRAGPSPAPINCREAPGPSPKNRQESWPRLAGRRGRRRPKPWATDGRRSAGPPADSPWGKTLLVVGRRGESDAPPLPNPLTCATAGAWTFRPQRGWLRDPRGADGLGRGGGAKSKRWARGRARRGSHIMASPEMPLPPSGIARGRRWCATNPEEFG